MTISSQEATAGVSRRAIAHIQTNGDRPSNKIDTAAKTSNKSDATREKLNGHRKTTEAITTMHSGFRCTSVIDTPMRRVDVVESINFGDLHIRETKYALRRDAGVTVTVTEIHLDYHEADALVVVLQSLTPPEEKQ